MQKRNLPFCWLWMLLLAASITSAGAQEFRATITGVVTDASKAVIPGATVSVHADPLPDVRITEFMYKNVNSPGEFVQERLGTRITMRLKERQHPLPTAVFGRGQRRLDLGRMMRVIVDHHVIGGAILHFKTPRCAPEFGQRADDLVPGDAKFRGQRDHAERVAHVLRAGHLQRHFAE